jgi:hypothetical protein
MNLDLVDSPYQELAAELHVNYRCAKIHDESDDAREPCDVIEGKAHQPLEVNGEVGRRGRVDQQDE